MNKPFPTIDELDVSGRRVLVRADLNAPVKDGRVTDATRIERFAETGRALLARGAALIVLSHFGRPKGQRVPLMSLQPVRGALSDALGVEVGFVEDCVGEDAEAASRALAAGEALLFENLRFHAGEEANDPEFAAALARCGDLYVNDAFSVSHRAHASIEALAHLLPAAVGRLMEAELDALASALGAPKRPVAAVVGGAKVSTKLDLLKNLVGKVDSLIIGGAMANTFLFAKGMEIGRSLHEPGLADTAREVLAAADGSGCAVLLPEDAVVAATLEAGAETRTVPAAEIPAELMMLDIGPATAARYSVAIAAAATLVWNGPLGAFETPPFDAGTVAVARAAAEATKRGALMSVAGGGDTIGALIVAGVLDDLTYVSSAGGAFLEWLEGKSLPGLAALQSAKSAA